MLGDARLRLREAPDHAFGLIVLDAFSSDSLPVHLLSREAIRLYRSKLAAGGVLAFNLSNRYLDLDPVLGRQAADAGLACRIALRPRRQSRGKAGRQTAVDLGSDGREPRMTFAASGGRSALANAAIARGSAVWTDDFSDLASYIRWLPLQRIAKRWTNRPARRLLQARMAANAGYRRSPIRAIQLSRRRASDARWD